MPFEINERMKTIQKVNENGGCVSNLGHKRFLKKYSSETKWMFPILFFLSTLPCPDK